MREEKRSREREKGKGEEKRKGKDERRKTRDEIRDMPQDFNMRVRMLSYH